MSTPASPDERAFSRLQANVCRALAPNFEVLDGGEEAVMPILRGHLAVFNEWTKVDSQVEGTFMERIAPGAFTKTLQENRSKLQVLFQHGQDPTIGGKPLGVIRSLKEDAKGVAYEVEMFDTSFNRDLLPGLKSDPPVFGASFSGRPVKDDVVIRPQRSDFNPEGLPEVTMREFRMQEFGPCIMPVYAGATAKVRSATDEFFVRALARDPEALRQLLETFAPTTVTALSERAEAAPHSQVESREPVRVVEPKFRTTGEWHQWIDRILTSSAP